MILAWHFDRTPSRGAGFCRRECVAQRARCSRDAGSRGFCLREEDEPRQLGSSGQGAANRLEDDGVAPVEAWAARDDRRERARRLHRRVNGEEAAERVPKEDRKRRGVVCALNVRLQFLLDEAEKPVRAASRCA